MSLANSKRSSLKDKLATQALETSVVEAKVTEKPKKIRKPKK